MRALILAFCAPAVVLAQTVTAPPAVQPPAAPPAFLTKLPPDWHDPVTRLLVIPESQHAPLAALADDVLRQSLIRQLIRSPAADEFVRRQLTADPSPRVRSAIVQGIAGNERWSAMPDTTALVERVVASDPAPGVSLAALELLRRARVRGLSALLSSRLAAAKASGDAAGVARLTEEYERWIALERGTMLPAFLREPVPAFRVVPEDRAVRALAFGDFGTGTALQKQAAQAISAYHRANPLDFAITLGDNFYTVGMESPSDPRWQTWFEDLYAPLGITFYAALGNHDWGHPDSPAAEILYRPASHSWRMPSSYYTFMAGPVQFFALDTQSVAVSEKQIRWLEGELSRSTAAWKIVYGHHPIYSAGNYEDRPDLIAKLLPALRNRADAYFCGHDHNLQALAPDAGVHFFVAGGGGAGLYPIRPHERTTFASSTHGFSVIEADAKQLTVRLVDSTGKTVYETTLKKGTPAP